MSRMNRLSTWLREFGEANGTECDQRVLWAIECVLDEAYEVAMSNEYGAYSLRDAVREAIDVIEAAESGELDK